MYLYCAFPLLESRKFNNPLPSSALQPNKPVYAFRNYRRIISKRNYSNKTAKTWGCLAKAGRKTNSLQGQLKKFFMESGLWRASQRNRLVVSLLKHVAIIKPYGYVFCEIT